MWIVAVTIQHKGILPSIEHKPSLCSTALMGRVTRMLWISILTGCVVGGVVWAIEPYIEIQMYQLLSYYVDHGTSLLQHKHILNCRSNGCWGVTNHPTHVKYLLGFDEAVLVLVQYNILVQYYSTNE